MSYIDAGKEAGAKVETGGKRKGDVGYFIEPTIFSNVTEDMKIMQEEIFGPVCSIAKFKTEEDAIKVGNTTTYGLAAGTSRVSGKASNQQRLTQSQLSTPPTSTLPSGFPMLSRQVLSGSTHTTLSTGNYHSVVSRRAVLVVSWVKLHL